MRCSYWVKLAGIGVVVASALSFGSRPSAQAVGENSITSPDTLSGVQLGTYSSLVLDAGGFPVVSYLDGTTNRNLKIIHCNDSNCAGGDESITTPDANTGSARTSIVLDTSGYPVVTYRTNLLNLRLLHCNDPNCSGGDESITQPGATVHDATSLRLDASGFPVIATADINTGLKIVHCNDVNCAGGDESITTPEMTGGQWLSMVLDANGYPLVSYNADAGSMLFFRNNTTCPICGRYLKILHCNDANCDGNDDSKVTVDNVGADLGAATTSLELDGAGLPVVSYIADDGANNTLRILHCNDANCTGGDESKEAPDSALQRGMFTSLELDSSGYPVVTYHEDVSRDLKVLRCNDANCAGGDDSVVTPDTLGEVGKHSSLTLGANGLPVVSYNDESNPYALKILHCGSYPCAGAPPDDEDGDSVADAADNCIGIANPGQENADGNFIDQSPPWTQDDRTWPNSDGDGDACDTDDDNDGLSDADETSGAACGSVTTDPVLRDTDGDRVVDGAECALGTDPTSAGSRPTQAQCGTTADADGDRLSERVEVCGYNTNPSLPDTDADQDGFPTTGMAKDGCEAASLNNDRVVNAGDQLLMVLEILREASPSLRLVSFDVNKDGAVNAGDQLMIAGFIAAAGACP